MKVKVSQHSGPVTNSTANPTKPVKPNSTAPPKKKSSESIMSSIFDAFEKKEKAENQVSTSVQKPKEKPADRQESLSVISSIFDKFESKPKQPVPEEVTEAPKDGKVVITKVYDFAGDAVE